MRGHLIFPRELLLIEIERHCAEARCNARTRIGLTKQEARVYTGFRCERCEAWNDDMLVEHDVPEWWEELTVTGLDGLRAVEAPQALLPDEANAVVERLSEAWRERARRVAGADDIEDGDGGDAS